VIWHLREKVNLKNSVTYVVELNCRAMRNRKFRWKPMPHSRNTIFMINMTPNKNNKRHLSGNFPDSSAKSMAQRACLHLDSIYFLIVLRDLFSWRRDIIQKRNNILDSGLSFLIDVAAMGSVRIATQKEDFRRLLVPASRFKVLTSGSFLHVSMVPKQCSVQR